MARVYTTMFQAVSIAAVQDLISILAPATSVIEILEVELGKEADTTSEMWRLRFSRLNPTHTAGSGGNSHTPVKNETGDAAAASTCRINDTTQATTSGTKANIFSVNVNALSGYLWVPLPEDRIWLSPSEKIVFEMVTLPATRTMNGRIAFREYGG